MFSVQTSTASGYHAANPNPQNKHRQRYQKANLAEFQGKLKGAQATGLPGIVPPQYPEAKFSKRVVFPTDKETRRDIQVEIDETRDAVYAQLLAGRESEK